MPGCSTCSAPLPANSSRCIYCGTRNDVNLGRNFDYHTNHETEYLCPHCAKPFQKITLLTGSTVEIERCTHCFGLFFKTGQLETLLQNSIPDAFDINLLQIRNINRDRYRHSRKFRYIKCPVCKELMNRVNFGHRSGVVVDKCRVHGTWLDNGELIHLQEWKMAGGQLLHERRVRKSPKKDLDTK